LGITDLARDHVQIIPAVVSPKSSHQRREKSGYAAFRTGKFGCEIRPRPTGIRKAHGHNSKNDRNLQESEQELEFSGTADANVVQPGNQRRSDNGRELAVVNGCLLYTSHHGQAALVGKHVDQPATQKDVYKRQRFW